MQQAKDRNFKIHSSKLQKVSMKWFLKFVAMYHTTGPHPVRFVFSSWWDIEVAVMVARAVVRAILVSVVVAVAVMMVAMATAAVAAGDSCGG